MRAKTMLKFEAIELRQKGLSINEIYRKIGAAKSSVSVWVRNVPLSSRARNRIKLRWTKGQEHAWAARRAITKKQLSDANTKAGKELLKIKISRGHAQLMCALIYWCEGSKTKNDSWLAFTNSSPELVAVFLKFFREGFHIDPTKFRAKMHLHDYHDEKIQLAFWSRVTKISPAQFTNTYQKPHTGKRKRGDYAGCIVIRYYDARIARQVLALARAFLNKEGL